MKNYLFQFEYYDISQHSISDDLEIDYFINKAYKNRDDYELLVIKPEEIKYADNYDPFFDNLLPENVKLQLESEFVKKIQSLSVHEITKFLEYHFNGFKGNKKDFLDSIHAIMSRELDYTLGNDIPYGMNPSRVKGNYKIALKWIVDRLTPEKKKLSSKKFSPQENTEFSKPKDLTANSLHIFFKMLKDNRFFNRDIDKHTITDCFELLTGFAGAQLGKVINKKDFIIDYNNPRDYEKLITKLTTIIRELTRLKSEVEKINKK